MSNVNLLQGDCLELMKDIQVIIQRACMRILRTRGQIVS